MAPDIIMSLRKHRKWFIEHDFPGVEIPITSVKFCYGDEILTTEQELLKLFQGYAAENPEDAIYTEVEAEDGNGNGNRPGGACGARKSVHDFGDSLDQSGGSGEHGADADEQVLVALKR